jgi:acyl carrier protein
MNEADIYDGLTQIFRDLFADERIALQASTTAADIDAWDSFNNLNIIAAAEERFGVKLRAREIEKLDDVGSLVRLILAKAAT